MAMPNTKQELADWILRRLGAPVVTVEIADVQLEDCIDEAVQWYQNWHFDGAERSWRVIKVDKNLINRNKRNHQDITAEDYDATKSYSKGSRVMHKVDNVTGNRIYIQTDSDGAFDSDATFAQKFKIEEQVLADQDVVLGPNGQMGIKVPDSIISVTKLSRVNSFTQAGMYNYEYQYFLNNFDWFYGSGGANGLTSYYIQKMNVDQIDFLLNTSPAIRYSKHKNRLYVDVDWKRINDNANSHKTFYFLAEVYEVSDPEIFGQVYQDMWLKRYATALAKMQWGSNLKKYTNTELPGGITLDGQSLYDEGKSEADNLEEEMRTSGQLEMDSILWG